MGMFDSVYVDCPHCGAPVEIQVQGDESMTRYTRETAPVRILREAMNGPEHCRKCDGWLTLTDPRFPLMEPERPPTVVLKVKAPPNPRMHFQGYKWWPDDVPFGPDHLE